MKANFKVAIVQEGPVYLNLKASLEKMLNIIEDAGAEETDLIIFGEAWLTGYPAWLDHCQGYAIWDHEPTKAVFSRMYQNSITVPGPEINQLRKMAKQFNMIIVTGLNEVVRSGAGNRTIYNSMVIIDENGNLVNHRRKLMPTYTEKLLYGLGDGKGLEAVETSLGRIGGLICWEHWMPLTRQAMHNSGEFIHIALWPRVHEMLQVASRAYAFEGRCYVIAVGQMMYGEDFPPELDLPDHIRNHPGSVILNGGSAIIGPDGQYLMEPQYDLDGTFYCEMDHMDKVYEESMTLDVTGHYQRLDVFDFKVRDQK
jgi:predicted amidohydrolase